MYESTLEYSINTTDRLLPKIEGSMDNIKSQLPQHPKGTSEKNEKNELIAVLLDPPPKIPFLLLSILQPKLLL